MVRYKPTYLDKTVDKVHKFIKHILANNEDNNDICKDAHVDRILELRKVLIKINIMKNVQCIQGFQNVLK